jgi:hypothetical protein
MALNSLPQLVVKDEVDWIHVKDTKEMFISTGYSEAWMLGDTTEVGVREWDSASLQGTHVLCSPQTLKEQLCSSNHSPRNYLS